MSVINGGITVFLTTHFMLKLGSLSAYVIDQLRNQRILDSTVFVEVIDMGIYTVHKMYQ